MGRGTASATGPGEAAPGGMGFRQRLLGVDVARALAIIGMLMVHFGPVDAPGLAGALYALPYGRASVLFVLVAGVGVSLLARSGRSREDVARRLIWRALVLFPLGLWLQSLDHRVLVILQEYAVLFLLAAAVLDFPDAALLGLAGVSAAAGPVAFLLGRMHAPDLFDQGPIRWSDPPSEMLMDLVVSGPYPLAVWAAPFLFGMWIGRRDLRSAAVRVRILAGGILAAAGATVLSAALELVFRPRSFPVTWAWLVVDVPHSQMPLWLIGATGAAAALLVLCLEATERFDALVGPLAATGQMALTVYAGHLLLLHFWGPAVTGKTLEEAIPRVILVVAVAVALSTAWRRSFSRGPLEALVRLPERGYSLLNRSAGEKEGGARDDH
ncbi:MAG: DUF418 domain-containing protein [Bacillota bacterium]